MLKHCKSLETSDIPSWEMAILEYFHEIQLDVSKYAKYLNWYVCSLYKYHLPHVFLPN